MYKNKIKIYLPCNVRSRKCNVQEFKFCLNVDKVICLQFLISESVRGKANRNSTKWVEVTVPAKKKGNELFFL